MRHVMCRPRPRPQARLSFSGWHPATNKELSTMTRPRFQTRPYPAWRSVLRGACSLLLAGGSLGMLAAGCLDRPRGAPAAQYLQSQPPALSRDQDRQDRPAFHDRQLGLHGRQAANPSRCGSPDLVNRLTNPQCISTLQDRHPRPGPSPRPSSPRTPTPACPANSKREFDAIGNIHIGVIFLVHRRSRR